MNEAERLRDLRIVAMGDLELLNVLVGGTRDEALNRDEFQALVDMKKGLAVRDCLSKKQRRWAEDCCRRVMPLRGAEVPRGKEVALPGVLQNLPKAPPGRRVI